MQLVLTLLGLLVVAVIVLVVIASGKPDAFAVTRSATIAAPAERVFDQIDDFRAWGGWSPWEKLDPALKRTYSGSPRGVGAVYEWEGNKKVGKGRMEITGSMPAKRVTLDLQFIAPFKAENVTVFDLESQGASTRVTWGMNGKRNLMLKVMSMVMDLDALIGKDFDNGLANMKALLEKS
jgi:Polyketide cyclase / dehydrase and lipid transport